MTSPHPDSEGLFRGWVRSCFLGWFLGVLLLLVLVFLWSPIGGGAQFMVGVGIGAGVGYAQGRTLARWLNRPVRRWTVASAFGMGSPFIVHDIVRATGTPFPYSAPAYVVIGALIAGIWQAPMLRPVWRRAAWWPVASLLGWALPAAAVAVGESGVAGVAGKVMVPLSIVLGGALLGVGSGSGLSWIARGPRSGPAGQQDEKRPPRKTV